MRKSITVIASLAVLLTSGCGLESPHVSVESTTVQPQNTSNQLQNSSNQSQTSSNQSQNTSNQSQNTSNQSQNTSNQSQNTSSQSQNTSNQLQSTSDQSQSTMLNIVKEEHQSQSLTLDYQPIPPSPNSNTLQSHYDQNQLENITVTEAHGGSQKRSVPFGQTLESGKQDMTDGPLKKYRIISYYGNPHSAQMGILGQYPPAVLAKKLDELCQVYSNLDPARPAIPAFELITTIAQRSPGPDGLYYHETSTKDIQEYAQLAKENHGFLILDVQLGHDTIMHQVQLLKEYLKLPYVFLAIDTEFHVKSGQIPGVQLGHVNGANVQQAIDYVSKLTQDNHLPDKVVFVHQFADVIVQNKQAIHPTSHVEVVLNNDGFGSDAIKRASYHLLVRQEPIQYGGFKVFYHQDHPVMTPKSVLTLDPAPAFVDYQ